MLMVTHSRAVMLIALGGSMPVAPAPPAPVVSAAPQLFGAPRNGVLALRGAQ